MRTKSSQDLAIRICDYYDKIAHGSRQLTTLHFQKEGVPKSSIYRILTKYDLTGTAIYTKASGRPPRVSTPQIIQQVARAYQIEPSVTDKTLARRFNIPQSTFHTIKMKVAKSNLQKYEQAQAQIVNTANANDSNLGSPDPCQGQDSPGCHSPTHIQVNCTICCQNIENCINAQESDISTSTSVISQTICKLFGIQDDFESVALLASTYCANCSSLILKIHKIWKDLDEAKLQLEEIIIKNSSGDFILDQNSTEIARNEIIKRVYGNTEVAVKSEDNRKDLNEVLDLPDCNLFDDNYQDNYLEKTEESQKEHLILDFAHNETGEFYFSLKTPVLNLTKLPQSLVDQLTQKNVDLKAIQNGIDLHLKKDHESQIMSKSTKSSIVSSKKEFLCIKCFKGYSHIKDLKEHYELKHHGSSSVLNQRKQLSEDISTTSISSKKERSHLCHLCSQTFTHFFHLRKHLKSHSRKNIMCPMADCVEAFESNDDLQDHLNVHNDVKVYQCSEDHCDSSFYTKKLLTSHLTLHRKLQGKFECTLCPSSFGFAKNLLSHKKTVHNYTESTELMCEICAKVFPSKHRYSKHKYRAHKDRRKHNINDDEKKQCPICRCWFKNDLKFERHMNIHRQLALTA